jgi:hypothetical protein
LFGKVTGDSTWKAILNFKALAATLLAKELAETRSSVGEVAKLRSRVDFIAARARNQSAG